jgi:tetraacyldisaccharide 4'-kinase
MNPTREQRIRSIMSGEARDPIAAALRITTRAAEPFYATAMRIRNALYNTGIQRQHRLPRPVISIGNITTGGTGKTPMVQWLARKLLAAGHRPASVLRGYTVGSSTNSDEATLLKKSLDIPVIANPNRVNAGNKLIAEHPEVDVILLDDGLQHRRLHRDLDIVLIDAINPFGYSHVLPRGMLREPLSGLRRADVFVITRSNLIDPPKRQEIERELRRWNDRALIVLAQHQLTCLARRDETNAIGFLRGKTVFSFCGIGNPAAFREDLLRAGALDAGHQSFADHFDYSHADVSDLDRLAQQCNADLMVTTEKDWVKLEPLLSEPTKIPLWYAQMEMRLDDNDGDALMLRVLKVMAPPASSLASPAGAASGETSTR